MSEDATATQATTLPPGRRPERAGVILGLGAWFLVMLVVGATLLGRHLLALPRPVVNDDLAHAMGALRAPGDENRWMAVHVLYGQCKCSQRIAEHLLSAERPEGVVEQVLLVGKDASLEGRLVARGYRVTRVAPAELLPRYKIPAVPTLIVVGSDGTVRYAGGYTTSKQGPDPRDLEIIADARAERPANTLPVFGCAVAQQLQSTINPLGLP